MAGVINFSIVVGAVLLSGRLYLSGLHRRYRAFFLFLIFFTLQSVVYALLGPRSGAYQKVWVLSEPIEWFLYVWMVWELYALVLHDYRGLYAVGRWSLIVAVSAGFLASGFTLIIPSHFTRQGHLMTYYYVAERAVYFSLAVFLVTILFLLTRYPITLNRNAIVHSVVFTVYFLSNTIVFLLISTRGQQALQIANYAIQAVNVGALATWLALLNPAGEQRPQRLRPAWMPGQEDKLVSQLNTLNLALSRVARI